MSSSYRCSLTLEGGYPLRETRTAESGAMSRDGSFYRMWIIRPLAMMLVAFLVVLGACGQDQEVQPEEEQPAQEDPAGQQEPQEEEGESD